ncbi:lipocalin family protein [Salinimicrobium sp. HB62]|uniref:lipocalin family protein n=1 Tax=Salinimicrobium sp. HB62 TaxID=3077781 RepID=UPI002D77969C|nr:lipocalin family protein [Salinimicrobium sp. HB62]
MKKVFFLLFLGTLLQSCASDTSREKIDNLNGYWEITKAELPEGIIKEFKFSELVDYIKVDSTAGFRKKVRPQLDGNFIASEDVEIFEVKVENDSINLYYSTPYTNWKETVISSEENELVVLNQDGIIYTYKRFTPYSGNYGQEDQ